MADAAAPSPTQTAASRVIFIAGATGYTGRALVAEGRRRGIAVVAHIRPGSRRAAALVPQFKALGATVAELPWEPAPLAEALATHNVTHVFSLLGITAAGARKEQARTGQTMPTYDAVDKGLTLMLHTACEVCTPAPMFVYLSSLGADSPGTSAYLKARYDVEAALREGPVPWLSVRPSFISGPDRDESRPMERVGSVAADALLSVVGMLGWRTVRDRYATVPAAELARRMLDIALSGAPGRTVDMADLRRS